MIIIKIKMKMEKILLKIMTLNYKMKKLIKIEIGMNLRMTIPEVGEIDIIKVKYIVLLINIIKI